MLAYQNCRHHSTATNRRIRVSSVQRSWMFYSWSGESMVTARSTGAKERNGRSDTDNWLRKRHRTTTCSEGQCNVECVVAYDNVSK